MGALVLGESVQSSSVTDEIRPPADRWQDEEYWKDIIPGKVVVCYDEDVDVYRATADELGIVYKNASILEKLTRGLNMIVVKVPEGLDKTKEFIRFIESQSHVKWAEPAMWMHLVFTPNDPYYSANQWDKKTMNCEAAWDHGLGSMDITAAVIDQGCQYTHPDLSARYGTYVGYDYYGGDSDPMTSGPSEAHGTHCSGLIAATINNGTGGAGVANVRLLSYRCGGSDGLLANTPIVNSIQECANKQWNVVSMSFGNPSGNSAMETACANAWNAGCLLLGATGNSGTGSIIYPARYSSVMAVGATTSSDARWSGSNYGSQMELVAGGVQVLSTVPTDQYAKYTGTSMACPNAAGAAALVWSAKPSATNQEIRDVLTSTAQDISPSGWDQHTGYGIPDCYAAIQSLSPDTGTPMIWASDSLNFRLEAKEAKLLNPSSIEPSLLKGSTAVTAVLFPQETILSPEPSVEGFKAEDTLYYDDGTPVWGYQGNTNALYWAVRFTPTGQCDVNAGLTTTWTFAGTPPTCSLFVWDDNAGTPGNLIAGPFDFVSNGTGAWQRVDVTTSCSDDNDFWLGYWMPWLNQPNPEDTTYALTDVSSQHGARQGLSVDRGTWSTNPGLDGDLTIRAMVTYGGGGGLTASGNIWVKNVGTGTKRLEISNVQKSEAWITQVSPTSFNVANGCSSAIQVKVDGTGLQKKVLYTDEIVITSNSGGKTETRVPVTLYIDDAGVEEDGISVLPTFKVSPNPSSERIDISYEVIKRGHVKLVFTDITGREVTTLSEGLETPGVKELSWRTANVPAGIYFCRFTTPDFEVTRKVLLVK
jgi:hypothetical protein